MASKSCDLNNLIASESYMGQTKPTTDQKAVAKQLFDLLWSRVGANIKIFGCPAQLEVTHAATDQISLVAITMQPIEHLESVLVNLVAGNTVGWTGQYRWSVSCRLCVWWGNSHGSSVVLAAVGYLAVYSFLCIAGFALCGKVLAGNTRCHCMVIQL